MSEENRVVLYGNPRNAPQKFNHDGSDIRFESERVYCRPMTMADATWDYARWFANPDVEKYLDVLHQIGLQLMPPATSPGSITEKPCT